MTALPIAADCSQVPAEGLAPHQAAGVRWLYESPRSLLADEVGLGKTVQTCSLLALLAERGELTPCLLVVPAHLIDQWRGEMDRWCPAGLVVHDSTEKVIRNPSPKERLAYQSEFPNGPDVLLVSYEFLRSRSDYFSRLRFRVVVLDEAATIKSGKREHDAVTAVTSRAERVHALTASPLENDATETYEILAAIQAPGLWPRAEFQRRFVVWSKPWIDGYGRRVEPKPIGLASGELPALRRYLSRVYLRRTADELDLALPRRVGPDVVWVSLHPEQEAALHKAEGRWKTSIKLHLERERIVSVLDGRSSKAEAALAHILARPDEPKFIVWAYLKEHLDVMAALLDRRQIGWTRIDGDMKDAARTSALAEFRDNPDCRVMLGTDAIGVGLNLQFARVLLSLGSSDNPGKEAQREGRIRRIGSSHSTYEHTTFLSETPHERTKYARLAGKRQQFADVFETTLA